MPQPTGAFPVAILALLNGCVSVHHGEVAELDTGKVTVDCVKDPAFDTPAYQALICTLWNHTDALLDAEVQSLDFAPMPAPELTLPRLIDRRELAAVAEAYGYRIQAQAEAMRFWGPVFYGLGTGLAAGGGARIAGTSPGGAAAFGAAAGTVAGLSDARDAEANAGAWAARQVEETAQYERHHILGGPFSIPAQMYVKRYVVVRLDEDAPWPRALNLRFKAPIEETVTVSLRDPLNPRARVASAPISQST